jgi:hypothetical protein
MYTRVESRFWADEKMRAASQEARYLMLYLLTNPHRNMIGLYYLPAAYACYDLGWHEKQFRERFGELLQANVIQYDPTIGVLWIKNYLRHNPLANPNQVKKAIAMLDEIPKTALYLPFFEHLKQFAKPLYEPLLNSLETVAATVSKQGSGSGTGSGSELKHMGDSPPPPARGTRGAEEYSADFEQFWKAYHPARRKAKKSAYDEWKRLGSSRPPVEELVRILKVQSGWRNWKEENGKYFPWPERWLKNRRWEDEPETGAAQPLRLVENVTCSCWPRPGMREEKDGQGRVRARICVGCGQVLERYE